MFVQDLNSVMRIFIQFVFAACKEISFTDFMFQEVA